MKDDTVYLRHIEDCIRRIEQNISDGRAAARRLIDQMNLRKGNKIC